MRTADIFTAVLLFSLVPASATPLTPMSFTTHLCNSACANPASGTTTTGSLPSSPDASVSFLSDPGVYPQLSVATVQGSPSPDPSVLATAYAVGTGTDLRANILYQYSFEVLGAAGTVPVTVRTSISVGGTTIAGGAWSSFAQLSVGGQSVSAAADSVSHISPTTINLVKTSALKTNKIYLVSLYADAHAQSFFLGDAVNDVYAAIDPTLSVPAGYSIVLSNGIGNSVPEPSTWAVMLAGLFGAGFMRRRTRNASYQIA